jgi:peroxiredoxin (alkyl hydroperoxide reductase subunit C)
MTVIAAGAEVPEFTLTTADGGSFTRADLLGKTSVLIFYPFAFSGGCSNQLSSYEGSLEEFAAHGATLYAISTDARHSQKAFKEQLGSNIEQLSDFEPKGAAAAVFGALHENGMTNRAVVVVGPDGVVKWSHESAVLGEFLAPEEIHEALHAV